MPEFLVRLAEPERVGLSRSPVDAPARGIQSIRIFQIIRIIRIAISTRAEAVYTLIREARVGLRREGAIFEITKSAVYRRTRPACPVWVSRGGIDNLRVCNT